MRISSSTKKERLQGYLAAGNLGSFLRSNDQTCTDLLLCVSFCVTALTDDDIAAIDAAGVLGPRRDRVRKVVKRVAIPVLAVVAVFRICSSLGYL